MVQKKGRGHARNRRLGSQQGSLMLVLSKRRLNLKRSLKQSQNHRQPSLQSPHHLPSI